MRSTAGARALDLYRIPLVQSSGFISSDRTLSTGVVEVVPTLLDSMPVTNKCIIRKLNN